MRLVSLFLLLTGFLLVIYAIFSRFYGAPSLAFNQFRSLSVLILANTLLLLSLVVLHLNRYFK